MWLDYDVVDAAPASIMEICNNQTSAYGPCSANLSMTGVWHRGDVYYYVTPADPSNAVAGDQQWQFPGKIYVYATEASALDQDLSCGMISVQYEFELAYQKSVPPTMFAAHVNPAVMTTITGSNDCVPLKLYNQVGNFDFQDGNRSAFFVTVSGAVLTYDNSVSIPSGLWSISFTIGVAAVASHKKSSVFNSENKYSVDSIINPMYNPALSLQERQQEYEFAMKPTVANDVIVRVLAKGLGSTSTTDYDTIVGDTFNQAGAFVFSASHNIVFTTPRRCVFRIDTDGTENRLISSTSFFSYVSVQPE